MATTGTFMHVDVFREQANELEELRKQVQELDRLEKRLSELESLCGKYKVFSEELVSEISNHKKLLSEWDWFFQNSSEMLCIASREGFFKRVNPAFAKALGYSEDELASRPIFDFIHPEDQQETIDLHQKLAQGHEDAVYFRNRYLHADGSWHHIEWVCPSVSSGILNLYAIARDITERLRQEDEVLYRAMHDSLTGLYNRAAFNEMLDRAMARANRQSGSVIALYLVDLNGFKQINDTHGHSIGDDVLVQVAQRFRAISRDSENVFRIGGDEFAFLLEGFSPVKVEPLAKRIVAAAEKPLTVGDKALKVKVGCSVGVSFFPNNATEAKKLIDQADSAMYKVKRTSKSGFGIFC